MKFSHSPDGILVGIQTETLGFGVLGVGIPVSVH